MSFRKTTLKLVLIDLSGTLHIDNKTTPYAAKALKWLRFSKVKVKFITNTTRESRRALHERLVRLGFEIELNEIFSSLSAARDLIERENLNPMYLLDDAAIEDFEDLETDEHFDSVVVGLAPDKFNWTDLTKAFNLLLDGGKLIAIHVGKYYKHNDGLALGPGPFVKALEFASGVDATVVGKPTADFFKAALGNIHPSEAVMIGDDVNDDIGGAQRIGIKGYLVKTGKYLPNDETSILPPPYKTVDNFSEAVNHIIFTFFDK